jgi:hypothetical protein
MDDGLWVRTIRSINCHKSSLNPCCNGWWSELVESPLFTTKAYFVLILVCNGWWSLRFRQEEEELHSNLSYPCCNGWWSLRRLKNFNSIQDCKSLNPCCNGWWSLRHNEKISLGGFLSLVCNGWWSLRGDLVHSNQNFKQS